MDVTFLESETFFRLNSTRQWRGMMKSRIGAPTNDLHLWIAVMMNLLSAAEPPSEDLRGLPQEDPQDTTKTLSEALQGLL